MSPRLRVAIITNLFPSNAAPGFAPFNRQQFSSLAKLANVEVYAIVPWRLGKYAAGGSSTDVVAKEWIDGVLVHHPRFVTVRGVPALNAGLIATRLTRKLRRRRRDFDVILGSYAYPDGCAAVLVGKALGLPVVVKCHGSDLNRVPRERPAKAQLQQLLPKASSVVVVSKKLGDSARALGVPDSKIEVVYNGVDRRRFSARDRAEARRHLKLPESGELVVIVSHLDQHKGTGDMLDAIPALAAARDNVMVAFVGDGPMTSQVCQAAEHAGVGHARVLPAGRVPHEEVPYWMAAANVVCLPSWDEGMPNVVREAHAMGRPVVATNVGGIPEAVHCDVLGRLVPPQSPAALANALAETLAMESVDEAAIIEAGAVPTWPESAGQLLEILERAAR